MNGLTEGRIVHFVEGNADRCVPGIVTYKRSDETADLSLFQPGNSTLVTRTEVGFSDPNVDGVKDGTFHDPRTCMRR